MPVKYPAPGELEPIERASRDELQALQLNRLQATLHSAYFAVGVGPGSEVLVPTYTWHATITPVLHCAATPVFCDIDPRTLTIDPAEIERKILAGAEQFYRMWDTMLRPAPSAAA
jgi:hypothetical protein